MVLTHVIGAVTVAKSEQMRLLGAFLPHHERRNLEEPIVYQFQFCWSRSCENVFLQYY